MTFQAEIGAKFSLKTRTLTTSTGEPENLKVSYDNEQAASWSELAMQQDNVTLIDERTLLSEQDFLQAETCDIPKTSEKIVKKKACKNCSCGLKELQDTLSLEASSTSQPLAEPLSGDVIGTASRSIDSSAAKSSCGSCYLGDAFRCSTCPYAGLHPFKPGEKIILANDDDDI